MNALLVLLILQSVGGTIRRDGDSLAIDAPAGAVQPELLAAVAACKPDLLAIVSDRSKEAA